MFACLCVCTYVLLGQGPSRLSWAGWCLFCFLSSHKRAPLNSCFWWEWPSSLPPFVYSTLIIVTQNSEIGTVFFIFCFYASRAECIGLDCQGSIRLFSSAYSYLQYLNKNKSTLILGTHYFFFFPFLLSAKKRNRWLLYSSFHFILVGFFFMIVYDLFEQ